MPRIPKRLTREQRQLIVDLSRQGFSNAAIGRQVPCNLETVRRWKPAEQLQGLEKVDLGEKPRQVPQSPYKQPVRTKIKRMAKTSLFFFFFKINSLNPHLKAWDQHLSHLCV